MDMLVLLLEWNDAAEGPPLDNALVAISTCD